MAKRQNDDSIAEKPKKEFDEVMLEVRRVTRVTTWGRQLSFRAIILVGNRKGKIGVGIAKWPDVAIAVRKATTDAYKNVVETPITENYSVPYEVTRKYKSALIKLIPASSGTGLKAWSSVRTVLDLAGYSNILSKIVGTNNKLNNALATVQALGAYKMGKNAKVKAVQVSDDAGETSESAEAPKTKRVAKKKEEIVSE